MKLRTLAVIAVSFALSCVVVAGSAPNRINVGIFLDIGTCQFDIDETKSDTFDKEVKKEAKDLGCKTTAGCTCLDKDDETVNGCLADGSDLCKKVNGQWYPSVIY